MPSTYSKYEKKLCIGIPITVNILPFSNEIPRSLFHIPRDF